MKIKLSTDTEQVEKINKMLEQNKETYGERYCPCSIVHDKDHICPCKEFIESTEIGECHCGKYIKTEI